MECTWISLLIFITSLLYCEVSAKDDSWESWEDEKYSAPRPKPTYGVTYGRNVTLSDYPCFCQLWVKKLDERTYYCGGTLIHDNQVITAAHCLSEAVKVYVCCGSETCYSDSGKCYLSRDGAGVFIHKGFLRASIQQARFDDIGYIKIKGTFLDVGNAQVCKLSTLTGRDLEGRNATVVGCGITESGK